MRRWLKGAVAGAIGLGVIGAGIAWYALRGGESGAVFRTATVKRGDLVVSISATGTVVPEEVIDVGAQIAGQIVSFGRDAAGRTVDYGSAVEAGTVLAKIDDSLYAADAAQAEAQVQAARAALQRAESDLGQLRAKLNQAGRDWQRAQKLGPSEALAEATFDGYRSAYEAAVANVAVGQAAILQARASLSQAEALFRRSQRNLGYTTITSPVKGVIIDRRVNIGQTVVASLNAPSLFLIAKDLRRMQVWVAVNEADIGRIRTGQPVAFTVDAFPGETFRGEVGKIRLNASMTQNVVTYTVEVVTDNSSGRLLPYLTANVQFELERRADVLQVPNAALRFRPTPEQIAPEFRDAAASTAEGRAQAKEGQRPGAGQTAGAGAQANRSSVWLPAGDYVRPLAVAAGLSDNAMTEVAGENLAEGLKIVTGVELQAGARPETSNPFTPSFPRGGGSAGGGRPR
ncbi:MAG: efflux RND transporter periplasmic adaptor subunit [Desulfobacterales bacterium]|jgi:HlyD family secretion protein|nr:efflux RND transporter periplasmic adaptor subunit [Desulfobacterales bacterium]